MIKFRCTTLWQLISIVRAATLELKASALRRAIEERYRADQPRAPRGTPIGGQWIDDVTHVAARKPRPVRLCDGFAAGCQNGGSFGSSGMVHIPPKTYCWDCAVKFLGIESESYEDQLTTIRGFDPTFRGD